MRNNSWLEKQLGFLIKKYFSDVKLSNPLEIKFGREAKFRFGSIKLLKPRGLKRLMVTSKPPAKSIITITSMFAKENVPKDVVLYTIAHEMCHYAHGFSSYNRRLFKYPHHGGVVDKELRRRGAEHLIMAYRKWIKEYRAKILAGRARI